MVFAPCMVVHDDFNNGLLEAQLITFGLHFQQVLKEPLKNDMSIFDVKDYFTSLSQDQQSLLSEVKKVLQLVLVMPATNATSERSFSALRRVKTYLRTKMSQKRLDH